MKGDKTKSQRDRFIETARELEANESKERFNETLRRVVKAPADEGSSESE